MNAMHDLIPLTELIRRMHIAAGANAGAYPTDVVASGAQISRWLAETGDMQRASTGIAWRYQEGFRVLGAYVHEGPPDTEVRILIPAREKV